MPYEVRITTIFTTGTTASNEEDAKDGCRKVLEDILVAGEVITVPGKTTGLFDFKVDKIEAEKL